MLNHLYFISRTLAILNTALTSIELPPHVTACPPMRGRDYDINQLAISIVHLMKITAVEYCMHIPKKKSLKLDPALSLCYPKYKHELRNRGPLK